MKSIGAGILGFTSLICVSSTYADGIPPSIVRDSAKTTVKISAPYKDANKAFQTETGSGVLITESGDILTARHVIEGWTKLNDDERVSHPLIVKIGSIYGTEVPAEVTNTDPNPDTDLALVSLLRPQTNSFVSLCYLSKSPDGEALYAFGFPNQNNLTPLPGTFGTQRGEKGRWTAVAPFDRGASGAPVYNANGAVVGLIHGGESTTANEITPILWAKFVLDSRGITPNLQCDLSKPSNIDRLSGTFTGILRGKDHTGELRHSFTINLIESGNIHLGTKLENGVPELEIALIGKPNGKAVSGKLIPANWAKYLRGGSLDTITSSFCKDLKRSQGNRYQAPQPYSYYGSNQNPGLSALPAGRDWVQCTEDYTPDNVTASLAGSNVLHWKQSDGDVELEGDLFRE